MTEKKLDGIVLVDSNGVAKHYDKHSLRNEFDIRRAISYLDSANLLPLTYSHPNFKKINLVASANYWSGSLMKGTKGDYNIRFSGRESGLRDFVENSLDYLFNNNGKKEITFCENKNNIEISKGRGFLGRFLEELGIEPTERGSKLVGNRSATTRATMQMATPKYIKTLFDVRDSVTDPDEKRIIEDSVETYVGVYLLARYSRGTNEFLCFRSNVNPDIAMANARDCLAFVNYVVPSLSISEERLNVLESRVRNYEDNNVVTVPVRDSEVLILDDFLDRFKQKLEIK